VWLDNGATTQKPLAVIKRLERFYRSENSNIHRAAHDLAARATEAYEQARANCARFLHAASSEEIVFVRGTTEGINLVAQSWGRRHIEMGDEIVRKYDRSSLRILGSVGEPINPEIWKWYHDVVGEGRCDIMDTWWQTETGGILMTPLPGVTPTKPGSATFPFFGVEPVLVKPESGEELRGNGVEGALCLKRSWPGQARTIYKDHARFKETYFSQYKGLYFTGDGCKRDEDGYYWVTGRIDDVLNVSGHRLGTAEVESALVEHEAVVEAAVVGYPHDIKGQGIYAYVVLYPNQTESPELLDKIKDSVRNSIGRFAAPDKVHVTKGLPKTRSGKILRGTMKKIADHDEWTAPATIDDPAILDEIGRALGRKGV
jgi:acetyl-CoA synthetase